MNLLCRLPHLFGQTILVEGREYFIGDNGVCADLFEEHGNVLLEQQDTWCLVHPEDMSRAIEYPDTHDRQPEGITHLVLPPGETVRVPEGARIETDFEKVSGRTKPRKKGKHR